MALARTPRGNQLYEPDGKVLADFLWDRSELSIIQGPIGCLSAETEVLTQEGWIAISEWDGEEIGVWDDGRLRMEEPEAYIDAPCAEMWHFKNKHALSMMVSDEHRMPLWSKSGDLCVRLAADVANTPGRYRVPINFIASGPGVDEWRLRLHVAICADGCFPRRGNQVVITVRKDRKKKRIRRLMEENGVSWVEHQHSTRPTERTFAFQREPWMTKRLAMWHLPSKNLRAILGELRHWDGLFKGDDERFDTTDREAADFVQYAAHACGRRATISEKNDPRNSDWSTMFIVHIAKEGSRKAGVSLRGDSVEIERVPAPGGRKYCFTTSSGFFLARHNGRVFVTGNSGSSTASCHKMNIIAMEQEPDIDDVRRTRFLIVRNSYRQLKKTTIKTWLEWFPESQWGEMIRSEPMTHMRRFPHPSGDGTTVECETIFLAIDSPETAEQEAASFEITGFWYNEAQFAEKEVIDELLSRCGRFPSQKNGPGATWHGGMLDLNAPTEGHWIPYMRGDIPLPVELADDEKMMFDKPDDWSFFVQPPGLIEVRIDGEVAYQPNPEAENQKNLKKTYMEQIRSKPKGWIDQRVMNKVGLYMGGKAVYQAYSPYTHDSPNDKPEKPVEGFPIIIGLDFGRDPAACFMQDVNNHWIVFDELIGDNESATLFAPRVSAHMAQHFAGFMFEAYGDPRGADRTQSVETTAYDVFAVHGINVYPATTDNNPEMRRSAVDGVLSRHNGLRVNHKCLTLRTGLAGGYHFKKSKGHSGIYSEKPEKNRYSHIVEAFENGILGGGEGMAITRQQNVTLAKPSPVIRHRVSLRRAG